MNSWNQFLQENAGNGFNRKELQHLYKNNSSKLVTLHIDYIVYLHNEIQKLREELQNTKLQLQKQTLVPNW
jgi:hypothetical protein